MQSTEQLVELQEIAPGSARMWAELNGKSGAPTVQDIPQREIATHLARLPAPASILPS